MTPTRRSVLTALGTAVSAAGCLSPTPADHPTATGSATPTSSPDARRVRMGRTVTVGTTEMTVENPRVRKAVVTQGLAHTHVVADAGQFVVVDVTVDGEPPDRPIDPDLRAVVDRTTISGSDPLPTVGAASRYAFPFPAEHHDSASIKWATGTSNVRWELPPSIAETLAREPVFVVTEFRAPHRNGRRVLELSVANEGDRDGRFAARASFEGFSGGSVLTFPVPAGKTRSYTGSPGKVLLYFENHGGTTLTLQYPAGDGLTTAERTVQRSTTTTDAAGR